MFGPLTLLGVGALLPKVAEGAMAMVQQKPNQPQQQQSRLDFNLCEIDKTLKARVLRHEHRQGVQQWLQSVLAVQAVVNGTPIPGYFVLQPKTQPQQGDAYTAVGKTRDAGRAVALRLDCTLLVSGTPEQIIALCGSGEPYCIIAYPKPKGASPYRQASAHVGGRQDTPVDKVTVVASLLASMSPAERKDLAAALSSDGQSSSAQATAEQTFTCQMCSAFPLRPGQEPINGHHPNCPSLEAGPMPGYSQNNPTHINGAKA